MYSRWSELLIQGSFNFSSLCTWLRCFSERRTDERVGKDATLPHNLGGLSALPESGLPASPPTYLPLGLPPSCLPTHPHTYIPIYLRLLTYLHIQPYKCG